MRYLQIAIATLLKDNEAALNVEEDARADVSGGM